MLLNPLTRPDFTHQVTSANLHYRALRIRLKGNVIVALDTDQIAQAGLNLMNAEGLDEVSTRRLAGTLNVKGPALYKHFRNKADLFDAMVALMLKNSFASVDASVDWPDWLRHIALEARHGILNHRDGARLLVASSPGARPRVFLAESLAAPLQRAGFSNDTARLALATLASFVVGWTLNEQNEKSLEIMTFGKGSVEEAFNEGVNFIVQGLISQSKELLRP